MTLSQLAFTGEINPNFPWDKSHWDNTVVKSNKKEVSMVYPIEGYVSNAGKVYVFWVTPTQSRSHITVKNIT